MKNSKKQKKAVSVSHTRVATIEEQAKIKAGTHFAKSIASDEELKAGRLRNSSKTMIDAEGKFNEATKMILEANDKLLSEAKRTEVQTKKACASVKSAVNTIKDQLIKVDNILGDNVEFKVRQLERVAEALKTISELSSDSKTMSIVSAMTKN